MCHKAQGIIHTIATPYTSECDFQGWMGIYNNIPIGSKITENNIYCLLPITVKGLLTITTEE